MYLSSIKNHLFNFFQIPVIGLKGLTFLALAIGFPPVYGQYDLTEEAILNNETAETTSVIDSVENKTATLVYVHKGAFIYNLEESTNVVIVYQNDTKKEPIHQMLKNTEGVDKSEKIRRAEVNTVKPKRVSPTVKLIPFKGKRSFVCGELNTPNGIVVTGTKHKLSATQKIKISDIPVQVKIISSGFNPVQITTHYTQSTPRRGPPSI